MKLRYLALILPLFAFAGCAEGPYQPNGNPNSLEAKGAPVVLLDEDLRFDIAVDIIRHGLNENRLLAVQAGLRNRTDHDLEVQVQTLFTDVNGMLLYSQPGNEAAWTSLVITAGSTTQYTAQAMSAAAKHFTVRVRYLHRPDRD